MPQRQITKRYAQALADLSINTNQLKKIKEDLEFIAQIFQEDEDINKFLQHPKISLITKRDFIYNTLGDKISKLSLYFLYLLLEKARINLIPSLGEIFSELVDEELNLVRVKIKSAVELTEEEERRLQDRLQTLLNKRVILDKKVESKLLGGMTVKIGDKVIDGSIRSAIQRMRERLLYLQK